MVVAGGWVTTATRSLIGNISGSHNRTYRTPVDAAVLPACSKLRFTFAAASVDGFGITDCRVGKRAASGDVYDFASAPIQALFGGSSSVVVGPGGECVTDAIDLPLNGSENIVVATYFNRNPSSIAFLSTVAGVQNGYTKAGSDAATIDASGYSTFGIGLALSKVEVFIP